MELTTIINHCYRFPDSSTNGRNGLPTRKALRCRVRHDHIGTEWQFLPGVINPAAADHLDERRFEFIAFLGLAGVFPLPHETGELSTLRRDGGRGAVGQGQAPTYPSLHAVFGTLGAKTVLEEVGRVVSDLLGESLPFRAEYVAVGPPASSFGAGPGHRGR